MNKKAFPFILGLIAILMIALAGCASGSEDDGASGSDDSDNESGSDVEEKTINFMHLWPEGSSRQHHLIVNDIIAEYEEANPGITVETEILGNEQYKEKLKVLSSSNELPDVGMTWAAGFLDPYVGGDMFAPLDDIIENDHSDSFVPGTAEAYAIDGTTYGLPLELNITPVMYNKAIFEEHGVEIPETFEELKAAVQTFVDNDVIPITLGNKDSWTGSMWYMYLADRIGGAETLTNAINRSGSFEDPALVEAAAKVQELVDMGGFVKGYNGLANDEAKGYFINEQAAMYLMATWDLPQWTTDENNPQEFRDNVGYFKFPTVDGKGDKNSYVGGPGVGLFVAEDSPVKDEAKDFVSFFVEKWGEQAVSNAGVIPATKVDTENVELPDMYIDVLNDLNEASNITLYADVQMSASVAQVHLNMIQALFGGEVSPEEFAKEQEDALAAEEE